MKKTLILLRNHARRTRVFTVLAVLAGLMLCGLFFIMADLTDRVQYDGVPVGLLDRDGSALSGDLACYLGDELGMRITLSDSYDELSSELIERHISAIVEVPHGFHAAAATGAPSALEVTFLDDYANAVFMQLYLDSYMSAVETLALGAGGDAALFDSLLSDSTVLRVPVDTLSVVPLTREQTAQREGFMQCVGFFLMMSGMFAIGMSDMILDDRHLGTYARICIADVRPAHYVSSACTFGFINAMLQIAVFFGFTAVMGYDIGVPMAAAVTLCALYSLIVVGFALLVGMYLESRTAVVAAIVGTSTVFCLMGGAYFPLSLVPPFMQQLARITPHFWIMDALRTLSEDNASGWWLNAVILALFALLCFILSGLRFSKKTS